jgi:predicted amidohydrolase YtcJ
MAFAEKIYCGGRILTMDPTRPDATALAVSGERILAVGSDKDMQALIGPETKVISLDGAFIMPGLVESHIHAYWGAVRDLFELYLGFTASYDEICDAVRAKAAETPKGDWISGGPLRNEMRAEMDETPRQWLDRLCPDHPIALYDTSMHTNWCNSRALELAGFAEGCADIPGGVIERNEAGVLTGVLAEAAIAPMVKLVQRSQVELALASRYFCKYFNSLGYTAIKDASANEYLLRAYSNAYDAGDLSLHVAAHITAFSPFEAWLKPVEEVERLRQEYQRPGVKLNFAKLFLDGVAPARTASFLKPYLATEGYDPATHDPDATLLIAQSELNDAIAAFDAAGFTVKTHAIGDNAARSVLNAIEFSRKQNGKSGLRHEVAHCVFVDDSDLGRFGALDAVAEVSPMLWMPNAATGAQVYVLGKERLSQVHRIRSLHEAGAEIIFATDWPASAPHAIPWVGLAGMLSRRDETGKYPDAIAPDQAITLKAALPMFTTNGARAMGMEGEIGVLSSGAYADFIQLSGDIREMTPNEIARVKVYKTIWRGQVVHDIT